MINVIITFITGFGTGVITVFINGFGKEYFKKRDEVSNLKGQIIDLIAVVTPTGYTLHLNEADRRRIQRASFHLEKLGKKKLAGDARTYLRKWQEVYDFRSDNRNLKAFLNEEQERINGIIRELDKLTEKIISG